ncbi:MAG: nucleotidyltransferase family protein [Thermoanaerobaculales bacterium]
MITDPSAEAPLVTMMFVQPETNLAERQTTNVESTRIPLRMRISLRLEGPPGHGAPRSRGCRRVGDRAGAPPGTNDTAHSGGTARVTARGDDGGQRNLKGAERLAPLAGRHGEVTGCWAAGFPRGDPLRAGIAVLGSSHRDLLGGRPRRGLGAGLRVDCVELVVGDLANVLARSLAGGRFLAVVSCCWSWRYNRVAMSSRLNLDQQAIAAFCRKHHISRLALFGSILHGDARPDSDVDILVEFEAGSAVGLIRLGGIELELSELLGRHVDLRTPGELSPYFRDHVLAEAEVQYAQV